ncbi:MAG: FkbM family methyltransferase [Proteobacteria bacterium]|nr:FkbM family methyltransferase [Pseudomonadota bacterium]MBU1710938.1 FkbM family methyltransferase [Pseudomonadota bacterium]
MKSRFLWRAFRNRFRDNRTELNVLRKHIQPNDIVCDIGANKGSYTFWLSKWASNGKVIAFEPQKTLADYLKQATNALKLNNVVVEEKAVSAISGKACLFIPGGSVSPGASLSNAVSDRENCCKETVDVVTLDEYFPSNQRVSALKIDVEGSELDVFKGAMRILKESNPLLVFECENRHLTQGSVNDVFEFLIPLGYRGYFVFQNSLVNIKQFNSQLHQRQTGSRYWDEKDYVNNFVFLKGQS